MVSEKLDIREVGQAVGTFKKSTSCHAGWVCGAGRVRGAGVWCDVCVWGGCVVSVRPMKHPVEA